jgi:hypothetical protein
MEIDADLAKSQPEDIGAYLLRYWQADPAEWRFLLEKVGAPDERWGFGDVEALLAFLRVQFEKQVDR